MNADLSQWSVENLKSMAWTFDGATRFSGKGLEQWDVSQVDDFTGFFSMTKTTFTPCTQRKIANSWGAQSLRVSLSKLEAWSTKTTALGLPSGSPDTPNMFLCLEKA